MAHGHAAEMLLTARQVGAKEALAKGLVSRVLPAEGFADAAIAYAEELAQGSPASFAMIKRQLREAEGQDFENARAASMALTRETLDGAAFKEAIAARREGRPPHHEGLSVPFTPSVSNN
jgi:2-(1,2-epoxy-1,2-dihydrophenyl)acetyl-CoA isomerase